MPKLMTIVILNSLATYFVNLSHAKSDFPNNGGYFGNLKPKPSLVFTSDSTGGAGSDKIPSSPEDLIPPPGGGTYAPPKIPYTTTKPDGATFRIVTRPTPNSDVVDPSANPLLAMRPNGNGTKTPVGIFYPFGVAPPLPPIPLCPCPPGLNESIIAHALGLLNFTARPTEGPRLNPVTDHPNRFPLRPVTTLRPGRPSFTGYPLNEATTTPPLIRYTGNDNEPLGGQGGTLEPLYTLFPPGAQPQPTRRPSVIPPEKIPTRTPLTPVFNIVTNRPSYTPYPSGWSRTESPVTRKPRPIAIIPSIPERTEAPEDALESTDPYGLIVPTTLRTPISQHGPFTTGRPFPDLASLPTPSAMPNLPVPAAAASLAELIAQLQTQLSRINMSNPGLGGLGLGPLPPGGFQLPNYPNSAVEGTRLPPSGYYGEGMAPIFNSHLNIHGIGIIGGGPYAVGSFPPQQPRGPRPPSVQMIPLLAQPPPLPHGAREAPPADFAAAAEPLLDNPTRIYRTCKDGNCKVCMGANCYDGEFTSVKVVEGCPTAACDKGCSDYQIYTDNCPVCRCNGFVTREPCRYPVDCQSGQCVRGLCRYPELNSPEARRFGPLMPPNIHAPRMDGNAPMRGPPPPPPAQYRAPPMNGGGSERNPQIQSGYRQETYQQSMGGQYNSQQYGRQPNSQQPHPPAPQTAPPPPPSSPAPAQQNPEKPKEPEKIIFTAKYNFNSNKGPAHGAGGPSGHIAFTVECDVSADCGEWMECRERVCTFSREQRRHIPNKRCVLNSHCPSLHHCEDSTCFLMERAAELASANARRWEVMAKGAQRFRNMQLHNLLQMQSQREAAASAAAAAAAARAPHMRPTQPRLLPSEIPGALKPTSCVFHYEGCVECPSRWYCSGDMRCESGGPSHRQIECVDEMECADDEECVQMSCLPQDAADYLP